MKDIFLKIVKNKKIVFLFFILYNFCCDIRDNFFVCSYLNKNLLCFKLNLFFLFYLVILFLVFFYMYYNSNNYLFNIDFLAFSYKFLFFSKSLVFTFFNFCFSYVKYFYSIFLYTVTNNFLYLFFKRITLNLFSLKTWFPVFKRHSYYGLFKANRQKWVEIRSENTNRIKY